MIRRSNYLVEVVKENADSKERIYDNPGFYSALNAFRRYESDESGKILKENGFLLACRGKVDETDLHLATRTLLENYIFLNDEDGTPLKFKNWLVAFAYHFPQYFEHFGGSLYYNNDLWYKSLIENYYHLYSLKEMWGRALPDLEKCEYHINGKGICLVNKNDKDNPFTIFWNSSKKGYDVCCHASVAFIKLEDLVRWEILFGDIEEFFYDWY